MRFMMLMIPLGYEFAPPEVKLDPERMAAMMRYNEELKNAGVLITLDGLHPPSMGRARLVLPRKTRRHRRALHRVQGSARRLLDDRSGLARGRDRMGEAVPASANEVIEIRQVHEVTDFPEEMQRVAAEFTELQPRSAAGR